MFGMETINITILYIKNIKGTKYTYQFQTRKRHLNRKRKSKRLISHSSAGHLNICELQTLRHFFLLHILPDAKHHKNSSIFAGITAECRAMKRRKPFSKQILLLPFATLRPVAAIQWFLKFCMLICSCLL